MDILGVVDVPQPLLWILALTILFYWYLTKNFNYWKSRGIPYPKPYPIFGTMGSFALKPFHYEEKKRYQKYGRVYGGFEGRAPYLSVGDPTILKNILIKDFSYFVDRRDSSSGNDVIDAMVVTLTGEEWKRVRNIITPVFTSGKLKKVYGVINDSSIVLRDNIMKEAKKGKPVDVTRIFGGFTMDVILSSAFGTKVDSLNEPNNIMVHMGKIMFREMWRFYLYFMMPTVAQIFGISFFSTEAMKYFKDFTLQLIKERKESGKRREDFLQLLLDAAEESSRDTTKENVKSKSLSLEEIVAQCVIFMAAGYDTTATTLSFMAYNLALYPECQEKLIKEIDAAYNDKGSIDYDAVQNMKYLDSVISETLRIFPAAIRPDRRCTQDYKLEDLGITIPKNMVICIPIYAIQHDPEFWPEPDKFNPERFLPENKANITPYTYLPFGLGPRNCIGMRFALMEMKICAVNIYRHFRFRRCSETKIPPDYTPGNVLIAPKSITLKIEVRNDRPST